MLPGPIFSSPSCFPNPGLKGTSVKLTVSPSWGVVLEGIEAIIHPYETGGGEAGGNDAVSLTNVVLSKEAEPMELLLGELVPLAPQVVGGIWGGCTRTATVGKD